MVTWHFVRHCEAESNADEWLAGHTETPLTPLGHLQCLALVGLATRLQVRHVLSSDLSRSVITAQHLIFGSDAALTLATELRERCLGSLTGTPKHQLQENGVLGRLKSWDFRPLDGESRRDVAIRVVGFLSKIPCDDAMLIVSHDTVISTVIGLIDGRTRRTFDLNLRNGERITRVLRDRIWNDLLSESQCSNSTT
jgi:broad specificity phosphatase PhoE